MAQRSRDYTIHALHHALTVLETFLEPGNSVQGVSEIAERLALNKSRVFRILSTLEQHRFVRRVPQSKQYQLGVALLAFGEAVRGRMEVIAIADPVLDELAEITGETVHLGVVDGDEAVCVARRLSQHSVRLYAEVGRRAPLHVGGVPRLLLAYMPTEEQQRILHGDALEQITDLTFTDPDELEGILLRIRKNGYNVSVGDLDPDVHSIAAPIRDHTGRVAAGLSVAGPSLRFPPEKVQECIGLVCQAADHISHLMGHVPSPEALALANPDLALSATEPSLTAWSASTTNLRKTECQT